MAIGPEEIGVRIRRARLAKGWTQLEFALEAKVSPATVQRWERGQLPKVRELLRVAGVLELPVEELVEPVERDGGVEESLAEIRRLLAAIDRKLDERDPMERLAAIDERLLEIRQAVDDSHV